MATVTQRMGRDISQVVSRSWLPAAGIPLAAVGGWQVARGGMHGFVLVIGMIAAISAFVVTLKRPQIAPFIVIALAIYDKPFQVAGVTMTTSLAALALFAPIFFRAATARRVLPRYAEIGASGLLIGLLIASATAADGEAALIGTLQWLLVLNMILGVAALCANDSALVRRIALGFVVAGAVASVFAILQRQGIYFIVGAPYSSDVFDSTFAYYSNFANFEALATVIGAGLAVYTFRRSSAVWLLTVACTLLSALGVTLALSRGAALLVAVGLVVLLLKQGLRPARLIGGAIGIAVAGWLIWTVTPQDASQRFIARFSETQGGDSLRSLLQAGGTETLLQTPLGIGFDNFRSLIESGLISAPQALAHAHSTYIQMGLDGGWLGLAGFLILAVGAVLSALRSKDNTVRITFGAALAGLLVQVTQDYFFLEPASLVFFGLLVAGAIAKSSTRASSGGAPTVERRMHVRR
ncbi:O-antigen ligase family protein [Demequina sp. SO4-13]|uniref:O-antigen ligase family protein n=1 Tax=Demequina sp. SO4-13 TaxID=3401027 RepID=UPI003AFA017D